MNDFVEGKVHNLHEGFEFVHDCGKEDGLAGKKPLKFLGDLAMSEIYCIEAVGSDLARSVVTVAADVVDFVGNPIAQLSGYCEGRYEAKHPRKVEDEPVGETGTVEL